MNRLGILIAVLMTYGLSGSLATADDSSQPNTNNNGAVNDAKNGQLPVTLVANGPRIRLFLGREYRPSYRYSRPNYGYYRSYRSYRPYYRYPSYGWYVRPSWSRPYYYRPNRGFSFYFRF